MSTEERPDIRTRFKKGRSGNPSGRPKGQKNHAILLKEVLFRKVNIRENDGIRSLPKIVVAAEVCLNNAIKGDLRSFVKIMEMVERLELVQLKPPTPEIIRITRTIIDPKEAQTDDASKNW
jgi:hypothetical protein